MGRKPFKSADEKIQIVLSVLRGEMTQVEAARRLEMSQTTIAKWQKQFLEGAHEALARGRTPRARPPIARSRRCKPRSTISRPPWVRPTSSSGCGVKGGLSTRVRGPRGDSQRGRHVGATLRCAPRNPAGDLLLLAQRSSPGAGGVALAGASRGCDRGRRGRESTRIQPGATARSGPC